MKSRINDRAEYEEVKKRLNELINETNRKEMLDPFSDNEYTREIRRLTAMLKEYNVTHLSVDPRKIVKGIKGALKGVKERIGKKIDSDTPEQAIEGA
ncbi:hypothetical protein [uncultured Bacteroides sp.]|uniref:hypothetical protein n=1 Tax=uncultured Bacteroides sp. TaxID=162156 RepID=UPI0026298985|nr:hypothetical protein [uncultured Bacteroides sp.]